MGMVQSSNTGAGTRVIDTVGQDDAAVVAPTQERSEFLSRVIIFRTSNGAKFPVNQEFITKQSPMFAAMLKPGTKESREREVYLLEVTAGTFTLFLKFACSGTYDVPGQVMLYPDEEGTDDDIQRSRVWFDANVSLVAPLIEDNSESLAARVVDNRLLRPWEFDLFKTQRPEDRSEGTAERWMQYRFVMAHYKEDDEWHNRSCHRRPTADCGGEGEKRICFHCGELKKARITCRPRLNKSITRMVDSYQDTLMPHLRLWVFGHAYNIPRLRFLSSARFKQLLRYQQVPQGEDRIRDMAAVTQYIFQNTCENTPLRFIVVDYLAAIARCSGLAKSEAFQELLRLRSDFSSDYMKVCHSILHDVSSLALYI